MKLLIDVPKLYPAERDYILSVLFCEFLGLEIQIERSERHNVKISAYDDCELIIADGLFAVSPEFWLKPDSLPHQPLKIWNIDSAPIKATTVNTKVPVIYGHNPESAGFFEVTEKRINWGLDIFGSAFFMLTRYEEFVNLHLDSRERFLGRYSLAYQESFLDRPIVNEYLELLWAALTILWPTLQRKSREYKVMLTHDVDVPFATIGIPKKFVLRSMGADLLLRRDPSLAWRRVKSFFKIRHGDHTLDPNNTFNSIMDLSEKHGLISHFYFIAGHSAGDLDGFYSIDDPFIRTLMKQIYLRGHEIGLHPSYNSFQEPECIHREFEKLIRVADEEGIQQSRWGGRQHYLRWKVPTTWQAWEDAGLDYDSTLSFIDVAGFRCGTCYEFSVFNLMTKKQLQLKEYPLIVMDITLFCQMNMPQVESLSLMQRLAQRCKIFNGIFVFLWHNNSWLRYDNSGEFYIQAVKTSIYPDQVD